VQLQSRYSQESHTAGKWTKLVLDGGFRVVCAISSLCNSFTITGLIPCYCCCPLEAAGRAKRRPKGEPRGLSDIRSNPGEFL